MQSPSSYEIPPNTQINITLVFTNDSEITSVLLYYCSLSPEFICHYPGLNMTRKSSIGHSNSHYWSSFIPEYENGTTMGYHFIIEYENLSQQIIPENETFNNYTNIIKASDNQFYFSILLIDMQSESSSDVPSISLWILIVELVFIITIYRKLVKYKNHDK